jgi:hypothetical protein
VPDGEVMTELVSMRSWNCLAFAVAQKLGVARGFPAGHPGPIAEFQAAQPLDVHQIQA